MSTGREIRLIVADDGWWSALDREMGVASKGRTCLAALENLDEAVAVTVKGRFEDSPAQNPRSRWFERE